MLTKELPDVNKAVWHDTFEEWHAKYLSAQNLMKERAENSSTLIEIAAQHPLHHGLYPNEEFRARLDRGRELFDNYKTRSNVEIYVPGSRHVFEGRADQVSLSEAGQSYLIGQGVPPSVIHGEDLNLKYKGAAGVYGSADECYVAACYYKDSGFGALASVCSPAQMMRKTLHYIEFGVIPLNFTVPTMDGFHDYLDELFEQIPRVLTIDSRLQGESMEAKKLRDERKPKDGQ
jgi:hypothetical protein